MPAELGDARLWRRHERIQPNRHPVHGPPVRLLSSPIIPSLSRDLSLPCMHVSGWGPFGCAYERGPHGISLWRNVPAKGSTAALRLPEKRRLTGRSRLGPRAGTGTRPYLCSWCFHAAMALAYRFAQGGSPLRCVLAGMTGGGCAPTWPGSELCAGRARLPLHWRQQRMTRYIPGERWWDGTFSGAS
jgi:hypothetical protein